MKRFLSILLALSMVLALCACGTQAPAEPSEPPEPEKPEEVKNVERLIAAIGEVSLEREKYITDAEGAYADLLEADKDLVENAGELFAARERYNALLQREADEVIRAIEAIGKVSISEPREAEILAADAAYEALPEAARELVTNYEDLLKAKTVLNVLARVKEAEARGETLVEVDGMKISYLVDEGHWAVVENAISEEYNTGDLAFNKKSITWTGYYRMITDLPAGWDLKWYDANNRSGGLCTNPDKTTGLYFSCSRWADKHLAITDIGERLRACADEALEGSEHGEYHMSIYAQRRALWCRATVNGQEQLMVMLSTDKALFILQVWNVDAPLTERSIGIFVHCLNSMIISNAE